MVPVSRLDGGKNMKKGEIVKLKDGYRVYYDEGLGMYYFTECYETALNLAKEIKCNE